MRFADKTTIYIPSRFDLWHGTVHELVTSITRAIGGATIDEVRGCWVMGDGELCVEHVNRVSWWHAIQEPAITDVSKIARYMVEMGEEAVMVEYLRGYGSQVTRIFTSADLGDCDEC